MNPSQSKTALVVGAGIAGASVCYALSKQNIKTILLESESSAAEKASGNPIGVVYPFLTKHKTLESEFSLLAYQYFLKLWESLDLGKRVPHVDGIHFLLDSPSAYDRYSHSLRSHHIPESLVCLSKEPNSNLDALLFPKGKALSPVSLTKELIRIANPMEQYQTKLLSWEVNEENGNIICHTEKEILSVDYLFLTQGYQFLMDPKLQWIPMKQVRGQIVRIPSSNFQNQYSILYGDYLTAEVGGERVLGASFDEFHLEEKPRPKETFDLWNGLHSKLPNLLKNWNEIDIQNFGTRVSYRTQSQDRHPVVGKLPNLSLLDTSIKYQNLFRKNAKTFEIPYYETVGILNGLGSRGLTHALLAAEILVCDLLSQTLEISDTIKKALKPDRFLLRKWKRDELT
ncbi:FAD-dependent 5-carboxymethylaminomethyl-2-thiouridine(34) oxidoreductase MnmC [Leptospira limi]|uniref:FAD-dependent 5-carboxymethylaminomethyl-2-thiouridine(34) oxidoreductase MnmC n=1 Tax=Leptospira limi TaxID=2950023 RepID=A0ABT3LVY7_9LEPT|nr:FAD-dependent 5-carboxymethylaminomethyl-2-thiouridine(34) oxidoreductase MnmC [Leptospira limi]MCW7461892.1 FAD-dependent 5-carboxymethylaminomethyl-2-thiouridine(34) oxidoreductase MnmC [Leptospira limi]